MPTIEPAGIVKPDGMLTSLPDTPTVHWTTTVPPEVSNVPVATGDALPVAEESSVIALAVAVPLEEAPNAVAENGRVATAVPGAATIPASRNLKFPDVPIKASTASVAALRAAVECVAIFNLL